MAFNPDMKTEPATDLSRLQAKEVMRKQVATLSPDDTIEAALATFEDLGIGGAPVADENGKLLGVLTLTDIARTEHLSGDRIRSERGTFEMSEVTGEEYEEETDPNEVFFAKDDYSTETAGKDLVGDWMTAKVISARPDEPLMEVCAKMVRHQIHRVFVIDKEKLIGVVSSFDVVRCVAGSSKRPGARAKKPSRP